MTIIHMLEASLHLAIRHYSETDNQSLRDDLKSALNLLRQHTRAKGSRNGKSKLTEKQVLHILKSTETQAALAEKLNVSRGAIGRVRRRETWRHLP